MNRNARLRLKKESLLPYSLASQLLDYNPVTGNFAWKARQSDTHAGKMFAGRYYGLNPGSLIPCGYISIMVNGHAYKAHRLAWLLHYGKWPDNQIDHKDQIRCNNWISNLREASLEDNARNHSIQSNNSTGVVGVCLHKALNKYSAYITVSKKRIHLGVYATIREASAARKSAEVHHGFHENHGNKKTTKYER